MCDTVQLIANVVQPALDQADLQCKVHNCCETCLRNDTDLQLGKSSASRSYSFAAADATTL